MMRKKIVSLCMALVLCLSLLPVTALAAGEIELYVGGQKITESGCYENQNGTWTKVDGTEPANGQFSYDAATATLTLNQAKIVNYQDVTVGGGFTYPGSVIAFSQSADVSLTIVVSQGTSNITGTGGIRVESTTGNASLSIKGSGSLDVEPKGSNSGITLCSSKNTNLDIDGADVTASSPAQYGVYLISSTDASSTSTIAVNNGSLTTGGNGNVGIYYYWSGTNNAGTSSLTVSGNAVVDTRNSQIMAQNKETVVQVGAGSDGNGGIVFNGKSGTVYGDVTLEDDLEIASDETLTIPDDSSLNSNGKLTNNGKIIVDNGGKLEGTINGNQPPMITASPVNQTVEEGSSAAFSVTASASEGEQLTYQWQQKTTDSESEWGDISNATTASYTIEATTTSMNDYQYRCVVTANGVSVISAPATLTVNAAATTITTQPSNVTVTEGETATFSVTATGSNLTYQWQQSTDGSAWANISGATSSSYTTQAATMDMDGWQYRCVVTDGNSNGVTSQAATLTVTAATVSVTGVSLDKTELSLTVGGTETLTATVAPDNATDKTVTWTSSNPSVATVENGVVTAVAPGTAVITATTQDGNHTATCAVTVRPDIPPANPNYRITVEATQGGTVTADPTAAKAGTTVTLTPVPDRGYQVGSVAVTDRFGDAVAVTEQANGTYTFTMPNGQVTVTVTFAETPLPFTDVTEGDWFYDAVRYAYETGLMDGVGDSLFAPNSETTRAQLVTILYRLEGEPEVSGTSGFTDVEADIWYTDAVAWAAQNGIVNGVSDTEFAPGDDITREQLAAILYRYAACQGYDVSQRADLSGFGDASSISGYAQEALSWAHAQGLVLGFEDGSLRPQGTASRAQIAAVLMRFLAAVPTA